MLVIIHKWLIFILVVRNVIPIAKKSLISVERMNCSTEEYVRVSDLT